MRKINLIYISILIVILSVVVFNSIKVEGNLVGFFYVFLFFINSIIFNMKMVSNQPFGYALWVNPILQLSVLLIKLDGVERVSETKRIIKYLNDELDPITVKYKLRFYKKQLKIPQNIWSICQKIKETQSSSDKVRIMQHLIKIALADRLLSDQEQEFLETVNKKIGLPKSTLYAILQLHIYVTEEDIRNQKLNKTYVNSSSKKAFSILGLEPTATMEEVKESYRELVKIYHPDKLKNNGRNKAQAKIKFQAITDAYQFLKNEMS